MYNHILDTFIAVADCGSLTKAAEHLYISPTAVMKQMNALESHLDLKLIERTPSGIQLTAAGAVIYQDAKFLIDYSKKSIANSHSFSFAKRFNNSIVFSCSLISSSRRAILIII